MKTTREILIDYISDLHPDMPSHQVISGVDHLITEANKPIKTKAVTTSLHNTDRGVSILRSAKTSASEGW